jgi:hypothetical protein
MKRLIALTVCVIFLVTAAGFASAAGKGKEKPKSKAQVRKEKEMTEDLCDAAQDFNKMLVWKGYKEASNMVIPAKQLWFLNEAEKVQNTITIENFQVAMCQLLEQPPVRPQRKREVVPGMDELMKLTNPTPTPTPEQRDLTPKEEAAKKAKKAKKEKKLFYYGLVLVRFVNQTTVPSTKVETRLVPQYWIYDVKEDRWSIDTDLADLFE